MPILEKDQDNQGYCQQDYNAVFIHCKSVSLVM